MKKINSWDQEKVTMRYNDRGKRSYIEHIERADKVKCTLVSVFNIRW